MPMRYESASDGGPKIKYRFWIRSSRGTDESQVVELPASYNQESIKDELEDWCSQFGAWHVSENMVRYGFEPVEPALDHQEPNV